jgi:hypothetical protein
MKEINENLHGVCEEMVTSLQATIKKLQTQSQDLIDAIDLLGKAYLDINWLLVEGFDTNAEDCNLDGIRETIAEIKQSIAKAKEVKL